MRQLRFKWFDIGVLLFTMAFAIVFIFPAIALYLEQDDNSESITDIIYIEQLIREYKVLYRTLPPNPEEYAFSDEMSYTVLGYDILDINTSFNPDSHEHWDLYMNCLFETCGTGNWPTAPNNASYVYRNLPSIEGDSTLRDAWRWSKDTNFSLNDFIADGETVELLIIKHERQPQLRQTYNSIIKTNYANFLFQLRNDDGSWDTQLAILISR